MIRKNKLRAWILSIYFIILDIMTAGTMAVGLGYGFHLFTISMISSAYYIRYLGQKMSGAPMKPLVVSFLALISYFTGYIFIKVHGPIYALNTAIETSFFVVNSLIVIGILTFYMSIFLKMINDTEAKLEKMALVDKLTGLYNRHYLLSYINSIEDGKLDSYWIAILDIDNFKKVNDVYGHNCGDYVLKTIAETAVKTCSGCTVCRWGGEEFIVLASAETCSNDILETLRKNIADLKIEYEKQAINVTATIGAENFSEDYAIDEWISYADQKLYTGKHNGKNQVVY
ncbi:MAG: GGDEF domain-containing protein [Oscillospiraceae bacterium]|nr:GGDEF domain-containing protein [Oscillospiraceae bacterium]